MQRIGRLLASCLVTFGIGCEIGPESGRGLRLPQGDLARGEQAFQDLGCTSCHRVVGGPARAEGSDTGVNVLLGGEVSRVDTYGELVTSIINPSHRISGRAPRDEVAVGDESKMLNFNDRMTVTQLIDLTAFLQSKYELIPEHGYVP